MKKFILSVLVQNNPGALSRISSLFGRKGYNIESLTVSPTNITTESKITMVVMGDDEMVDKVFKQVSKLEETLKVVQVKEDNSVCKELVLMKLQTKDTNTYSKINDIVAAFEAKLIHKDLDTITVELADVPSKVESFVGSMVDFDVMDICRTGVTALESC